MPFSFTPQKMSQNSLSHAISSFLILTIILAATGIHAVTGRDIPTKSKDKDIKQPEWLIQPDGSMILPGIGRILVPMPGHYHAPSGGTSPPFLGSGGTSPPFTGSGGGDSGGSHIPGGDDTFVPNPGYEIPTSPLNPNP